MKNPIDPIKPVPAKESIVMVKAWRSSTSPTCRGVFENYGDRCVNRTGRHFFSLTDYYVQRLLFSRKVLVLIPFGFLVVKPRQNAH